MFPMFIYNSLFFVTNKTFALANAAMIANKVAVIEALINCC